MEKPQDHFKRPNKISIILSLVVIVSLVFVILAFRKTNELKVQLQEVQLENEKLKDEAEAFMEKAVEMAAIAKQAESEALMQKNIADRALIGLQECITK